MKPKTFLFKCDALSLLKKIQKSSIDFTYIDPPYNTGKRQEIASSGTGYIDKYDNYEAFIKPIIVEFHRVLKSDGVLAIHLNHVEYHYVKVLCDTIFGRSNFLGEIIHHSELGASSRKFWAMKHTAILLYSKGTPKFNEDMVPMVPKSPASAGSKRLTSVWYHTLSNTAKERVDYPNQKAEYILETLIKVHSNEGDTILDTFAGSGTTSAVAKRLNRASITCDTNSQAIKVCEARLGITAKSL